MSANVTSFYGLPSPPDIYKLPTYSPCAMIFWGKWWGGVGAVEYMFGLRTIYQKLKCVTAVHMVHLNVVIRLIMTCVVLSHAGTLFYGAEICNIKYKLAET